MSLVVHRHRRPLVATAIAMAAAPALLLSSGSPVADLSRVVRNHQALEQAGKPGEEALAASRLDREITGARSAPGILDPGAYSGAYRQVTALPVSGSPWSEVTTRPYDSDSPKYRDPIWSNSSGGAKTVTGRVTGIAIDGSTLYAAGAAGGVFRSTNGGTSWTAISDNLPSLSIGDLQINPRDHSLWLATGEGTTAFSEIVGSGVYRRASGGTTWEPVGVDSAGVSPLEGGFINKLRFDGAGSVYAASQRGLYKHTAGSAAGTWTRWDPNPAASQANPYQHIVDDVVIQPRTGGRVVLANAAWRAGAPYNGFYLSKDYGASFTKINPTGAINPREIGNSTFAYSADGSKLYVVVESTRLYNSGAQLGSSVLAGIYASPNGSVTGPWNLIADFRKLQQSGSALTGPSYIGYSPGVQAWYNQFLGVDPANPLHVYVGLEEVFETWNGGTTWTATGRYWNFGQKCWSIYDSSNTCDGNVIHSDQHTIAFANGRVYVGNDGGLYSKTTTRRVGWDNLNANLHLLQYYGVGVGKDRDHPGSVRVWGGLQDNGQSMLSDDDAAMVSPVGGDGGEQLVDPENGCKSLGEYVGLELLSVDDCGRSDGSRVVIHDISPGDPNPRFIAPFGADTENINAWVAGGQYVWTNGGKGWDTRAGDWVKAYDQGYTSTPAGLRPRTTTALASSHGTIYAGWCTGCNIGSAFSRGISTNAGGPWRQLDMPDVLPNRYIDAITVDPADTNHVYVVFSGFSRRWNEGPGAGIGHVFESSDAGASWTDISSNLPDVPGDDLVIAPSGALVLATDLGVYVRPALSTTWSTLGGNLPLTLAWDLTVGPDPTSADATHQALYVGTYGRGIWKTELP
ncbi:MAG: glycosyl hydrolase [Actinobacteria bacterium]|nr:glycosyl hydrolase [Actinomycetota bacterium]MCA1722271.1 glycosyl hydrolase [Actinomycetota bacterium]